MPSLTIESIDSSQEVKGRAIAKIDGPKSCKDSGKIIYINSELDRNKDNEERKVVNMLNDIIDEEVKNSSSDNRMRKRMNDMNTLKKSFMEDMEELKDVRLNSIYQQIKKNYSDQVNREYQAIDGCTMKPIPNIDTRECVYVAGPSGSGKSTYVKQYAESYNKLFPRRAVYLFSKVQVDESLAGIKNLKRIDLNEEIYKEPIQPEELKKSLCIFDDVSTINDKKIREAIFHLISDILEIGRHSEVYICVTNHLLTDYKNTRTILNECSSITFFPSAGSSQQIKYTLKTYFGLDAKDINKILKLPTRWATVYKNFPQCVLYQTGAYLI